MVPCPSARATIWRTSTRVPTMASIIDFADASPYTTSGRRRFRCGPPRGLAGLPETTPVIRSELLVVDETRRAGAVFICAVIPGGPDETAFTLW